MRRNLKTPALMKSRLASISKWTVVIFALAWGLGVVVYFFTMPGVEETPRTGVENPKLAAIPPHASIDKSVSKNWQTLPNVSAGAIADGLTGFKTVSERQAAWEKAILEVADSDLRMAMELFALMPVTFTNHPKELLLGKLFEKFGPQALGAALTAGLGIDLSFNALRKSSLNESVSLVSELAAYCSRARTTPSPADVKAVMQFLSRDGITDFADSWKCLAPLAAGKAPDAATLDALAEISNVDLARLVTGALTRPWDAQRFRHAFLENAARAQGAGRKPIESIKTELTGEAGASQGRRFAVLTATHKALTGDLAGSLAWSAELADSDQRGAASNAVINHLKAESLLRPLRVALENQNLANNPLLMESIFRATEGAFGEREAADIALIREMAIKDPSIALKLRSAGILGILP